MFYILKTRFTRLLTIGLLTLLGACQTVDNRETAGIENGISFSEYPLNKRLELANSAYIDGDLFEAEKRYLNILLDHERVADAWFKLGNIYYRTGRFRASVNAYESVLKIDNKHAKSWYNLSLSRLSQAIETIDQSLEVLDDSSPYYQQNLSLKKSLLFRISRQQEELSKAPKNVEGETITGTPVLGDAMAEFVDVDTTLPATSQNSNE